MTAIGRQRGIPQMVVASIGGAVFLTLALAATFSLIQVRAAFATQLKAEQRQAEFAQLATRLGGASDLLTSKARQFAVTGDTRHLDDYWKEIDQTRTRDHVITRLKELGATSELLGLLDEAKKQSDALVTTETRSMRLTLEAAGTPAGRMPKPVAAFDLAPADSRLSAEQQRALAVRIMFDQKYEQDKALIMTPVAEFESQLKNSANAEVAKATNAAERASTIARWTLLLLCIGFPLALIGVLVAQHLLIGGVIVSHARSLSGRDEHDLAFALPVKGARELRELAERFNQQLAGERALISTLAARAEEVAGSAQSLDTLGRDLVDQNGQASAQAATVGASTVEVSGNVGSVSAGMDQMGSSISEIARNAASAATVAENAVQLTHRTQEIVTRLGDSSAEIGTVVGLINAIAEQTNLLALNATIEAARAGEAGKGFAVVATEVKELAQQTARATGDITSRMEAIQGDTRSVTEAINEIGEVIGRINSAQSTIASAVEEQTATVGAVSRSLNDAASGTQRIVEAADSATEAVERARVAAGTTQEAAAQLRDVAEGLRTLVSGYRV